MDRKGSDPSRARFSPCVWSWEPQICNEVYCSPLIFLLATQVHGTFHLSAFLRPLTSLSVPLLLEVLWSYDDVAEPSIANSKHLSLHISSKVSTSLGIEFTSFSYESAFQRLIDNLDLEHSMRYSKFAGRREFWI